MQPVHPDLPDGRENGERKEECYMKCLRRGTAPLPTKGNRASRGGFSASRTLAMVLAMAPLGASAAEGLTIGSKRFTESYILGEAILRAASAGGPAVHRAGLGNTGILYAALSTGAIDLYPEYSGTIAREILRLEGNPGIDELNRALAPLGLAVSVPLGFSNNYALGLRSALADKLSIHSIGDLAAHPQLKLGLSQEFLARPDGWPGLSRTYRGLQRLSPIALDHGLAYEALAAARVDVIDLYSTDPKIARYGIKTLADDRGFFPRYEALLLHRADAPVRFPGQWRALSELQGRIDTARMMRMNAAAELDGASFAEAAALAFPGETSPARRSFAQALFAPDLWRLTLQHLLLVFGSLAASIAVGIPLGMAAVRSRALAQPIFAVVGVIQTIPSLALLAFFIAFMRTIGTVPALAALSLYALLPIVRNTHAGLAGVGDGLRQAATALGLSPAARLRHVELPLARPAILAGIKTSAVINVGTATIAAFIGAGGYGERILAGLALNDHAMLLAGAVPAALMAVAIQGLFELLERRAAPV
jgi:osmoprotectant transport system permease protein